MNVLNTDVFCLTGICSTVTPDQAKFLRWEKFGIGMCSSYQPFVQPVHFAFRE